ncbi:MAG TPA: hypothetical protein VD905_01300 [Flavobacteriales bacterium]|nr:hypothetical protein [Flavobacteriales bacterium]
MKRSSVKAWLSATLVATVIGSIAWAAGPIPSAKTMGYYHADRDAVYTDIANIDNDREAIRYHKQQLKKDRKADQTIAVIVDKKEISKAKADLKKDKKYLRADKKDLFRDRKASIRAAKKGMRETKSELRAHRRGAKREMRKENYAAARNHLDEAMRLTTILNGQETALDHEREGLKNDRVAIRKEIRDERRDENGYAKVSVETNDGESYSVNPKPKK